MQVGLRQWGEGDLHHFCGEATAPIRLADTDHVKLSSECPVDFPGFEGSPERTYFRPGHDLVLIDRYEVVAIGFGVGKHVFEARGGGD